MSVVYHISSWWKREYGRCLITVDNEAQAQKICDLLTEYAAKEYSFDYLAKEEDK